MFVLTSNVFDDRQKCAMLGRGIVHRFELSVFAPTV